MANDLQTYCENCGRNFEARYNPSDGLTNLECPHCPDTGRSFGIADVADLPAASRATIHRMLERTGEKEGNAAPPLPPCLRSGQTMPEAKVSPLQEELAAYEYKPLKLSAKEEELLLFDEWLHQQLCLPGESWANFLARQVGVPASELGVTPEPVKPQEQEEFTDLLLQTVIRVFEIPPDFEWYVRGGNAPQTH